MMKRNFIAVMVMFFLALLVANCEYVGDESKFVGTLSAQETESDSVDVLIDSTVTIDFEATIEDKVSGFGCYVNYDSTQIQILDIQTYNVFDIETAELAGDKQGQLVLGFSQTDCLSPIEATKQTVLSVTFHIKLTAQEGFTPLIFENCEANLCDDVIPSDWNALTLFIKRLNRFILNMKVRA